MIVSRLEVDELLRFGQALNQLGHGGLGAQHVSKHLHCLERNTVSEAKKSGYQGEGKRDSSNGMMQFMLNHHCLFYLTWPLLDPSLYSRMSCRPHPLTLPVEALRWKESCTLRAQCRLKSVSSKLHVLGE